MPNTDSIFAEREAPRPAGSAVKALIVIAALAVVGTAAYFLASAVSKAPSQGAASGTAASSFAFAKVTKATIRDIVSVSGSLELSSREIIAAPRAGIVMAIRADAGETVAPGDILFQIDASELERDLEDERLAYRKALGDAEEAALRSEYSLKDAVYAINQAERALATAQAALDQKTALQARGVASAQEVDTARTALRKAEDDLAQAHLAEEETRDLMRLAAAQAETDKLIYESAIAELEERIAACTVRSETGGLVYSMDAEAGGTVTAYEELAIVADPYAVRVALDVPETQASKVKPGMEATVYIGDQGYKARIDRVSPTATSSSSSSVATVRVNASFLTKVSGAVVGSSVSAEIVSGVLTDALVLPRGPYLSSGNYAVAYLVQGEVAVKRNARFGVVDGANIQIISGLSEGDEVIVSDYRDIIHLDETPLGGQGE